jgi:hypothetical protein
MAVLGSDGHLLRCGLLEGSRSLEGVFFGDISC